MKNTISIENLAVEFESDTNQQKVVNNIIKHTITVTNNPNHSSVFFNSYDEKKAEKIVNIFKNEDIKTLRLNGSSKVNGVQKMFSFKITNYKLI
jgi:hypothetical protein